MFLVIRSRVSCCRVCASSTRFSLPRESVALFFCWKNDLALFSSSFVSKNVRTVLEGLTCFLGWVSRPGWLVRFLAAHGGLVASCDEHVYLVVWVFCLLSFCGSRTRACLSVCVCAGPCVSVLALAPLPACCLAGFAGWAAFWFACFGGLPVSVV